MSEPRSTQAMGRPRDPDVDRRILEAVLDVYASKGWHGLSIKVVAARAHTGPTSVSMRWPSRSDLLAAALTSINIPPRSAWSTPRQRLVVNAQNRAAQFLGRHGAAILRYELEQRLMPDEFLEIRQKITAAPAVELHRWLEGEIAAGTVRTKRTADSILEAIEGSAIVHALITLPEDVPRVLAALPQWAESLVDSQLDD
jgi:AcrR family transcriptional regulator